MEAINRPVTFKALTGELVARGLLDTEAAAGVDDAATALFARSSTPWYITLLSGMGAVLASIFFSGFAAMLTGADELSMVIIGVVALLAGTGAFRSAKGGDGGAGRVFVSTFAFSLVIIGKLMIAGGVAEIADSSWGFTFALVATSAFTWFACPVFADRAFSSLAVLVSAQMSLHFDFWHGVPANIAASLFVIAQAAVVVGAFTSRKAIWWSMPVAYGAACSLFIEMIIVSSPLYGRSFWDGTMLIPHLVSVAMAAGVYVSASWASARSNGKHLRGTDSAFLAFGLLLLALFKAHGVLVAIVLLVLGHGNRDKVLTGLGLALLPLYLWFYYYSLELTLLEKSGVLVFSGIVLLAGKLYIGLRERHGNG